MDLSKTAIFAMMQQRMKYLSERQAVLAQNVANANTPGYKPQDLKPLDFSTIMQQKSSEGLKTTHPGHVSSSTAGGSRFGVQKQKTVFETTPDGNAVNLEEQILKMQENNMDYQTTTSLYRKMSSLVNIAIGNDRR